MSEKRNRVAFLVLSVLVLLFSCVSALAEMSDDDRERVMSHWDDLMHYALIGSWDLAKGHGEALLALDSDPELLLDLSESDRYSRSYRNLSMMAANTPLKDIVNNISQLIDKGRTARRTAGDRIVTDVARLSGTTRGRLKAVERLKESGEWAVPVMIEALRDPGRSGEYSVLRWAFPKLGKSAVNPLVMVLLRCRELNIQIVVMEILGEIGYGSALPYIQEIIEGSDSPAELKAAGNAAFKRIDLHGLFSGMSAAELYEAWAGKYYDGEPSLAVPANQDIANIWFWDEEKGLVCEEVAPGAFDELMAMRCCEYAVSLNPNLEGAVSLWLSAFFRLEAQGHSGPMYFGSDHADAQTYALTAGPEYLHRVLARALSNRNRTVALNAIKVLQRNAGQKSLLYRLDGRQPLIDALSYPDREVRFSAALAIGGALPVESFEHSEQVTPILSECLRQQGNRHAVVIDGDANRRNRVVAELIDSGQFADVVGGSQVSVAIEQVDRLASFDLLVVAGDVSNPGIDRTLSILSRHYRLAFCPTIVLADDFGSERVKALEALNSFAAVEPTDASVTEMLSRAWSVYERNQASPFSQDQADAYATEAAGVLELLAVTDNKVLEVEVAEAALIAALHDKRGVIQQAATKTLARVDSTASQRAIAELALDEAGEMSVRLLGLRCLALSAKRHGQLLAGKQIDALYGIVSSSEADAELRNLSAEAYGALNLPSAKISQLIIDQSAVRNK